MSVQIAKKKFIVEATEGRLWKLIGRAIFDSLPGLENVEILDENNWRAILRDNIGFIRLKMGLEGENIQTSPPNFLDVKLKIKSSYGIIRLNQNVTVTFHQTGEAKTEVTCEAMAEETGLLFRLFLLPHARKFGRTTFEAIEKYLKELA